MPIRIEYGAQVSPGLPAMAQTAMRIRAEAAAAARRGGGGGGGGRGGQTNLAQQKYDLAAQQAYYDKQASGQKSDNVIRETEYKARLEAQGLDLIYTQQQRQELARINNSRQQVKSSDIYSPEEQATMLRELDFKEFGIEETVVPADRNKLKLPENQAQSLNGTWEDQLGNTWAYDRSGSAVLRQEFKDTQEGVEQKAAIDRKGELQKLIIEYSTTKIRNAGTDKIDFPSEPSIDKYIEKATYAANVIEAGGVKEYKAQRKAEADAAKAEKEEQDNLRRQESQFRIMQEAGEPTDAVGQGGLAAPEGYANIASRIGVSASEAQIKAYGNEDGTVIALADKITKKYIEKDGTLDEQRIMSELGISSAELIAEATAIAKGRREKDRQPTSQDDLGFFSKNLSFLRGT